MAQALANSSARKVDTEPDTIEATLNYIVDDGTKVFTETGAPGANDRRAGGKPDPHRVTLHNGRHRDFTLEHNGFHFIPHDTKVEDFFDEAEVRRVYYPEMEALVKAETGASRVLVFDHTLRTADDASREALKIREVVSRVHNDYTEWSGPQRVRDLVPDEADDLLRRRFAIIQVWRPIRHPVETFPLAIADARTLSSSRSGATRTASGKPTPSPIIPITPGTGTRRCGATRRWCSKPTSRSTTAAHAGRRMPRSKTRPHYPVRGRARASKSGHSRFSKRPRAVLKKRRRKLRNGVLAVFIAVERAARPVSWSNDGQRVVHKRGLP
jgi:hypothetical protein